MNILSSDFKVKFLFMGCSCCVPFADPIWFEYYGPIRESEVNNAINAAVIDRIHELGSLPPIPIKKVVAPHIKVPISLAKPHICTIEEEKVIFSFSSECTGNITLQTENSSQMFEFLSGNNQKQEFLKPESLTWILKFDIESSSDVSCRIFTLNASNSSDICITDDKIVINGKVSTIHRVYSQEAETNNNGFNEGLCLICCTERATIVAFPCRHCCMCRECGERFSTMAPHCPVCRATVSELIECVSEENNAN